MKTTFITGLIAATTLVGVFSQVSAATAFEWDNTWQQSTILNKSVTGFNDVPFQQFVQKERVAIPGAQQFQLDPAKLKLAFDHNVSVFFINEGAGFRNQIAFEATGTTAKSGLVFSDVSSTESLLANADGPLKKGDGINLGNMTAGTQLDFWLRADGWTKQKAVQADVEKNQKEVETQKLAAKVFQQEAEKLQLTADKSQQDVDVQQKKLDQIKLDQIEMQKTLAQLKSDQTTTEAAARTAKATQDAAANAATNAANVANTAQDVATKAAINAAAKESAAKTASSSKKAAADQAAQVARAAANQAAQAVQTATALVAQTVINATNTKILADAAAQAATGAKAMTVQAQTNMDLCNKSVPQAETALKSAQDILKKANQAVINTMKNASDATAKAESALNKAKTAYDGVNIFGTQTASNADGLQHVVSYAYENYIILGFEDLYGDKGATGGKNQNSDRDFNDTVLVLDIGAANVRELVSPTRKKVPEPSVMLPLVGAATFGLSRLRRRKPEGKA